MKTFLVTLAAWSMTFATAATAMEVPLYETGPAEDSSFVRFVNAAAQPMEIVAAGSNARLSLNEAKPASDFLPVRAGKPVEGALVRGAERKTVVQTVQPGQFVSVVGLDDASGGLRTAIVKEQPDDFNALKASVAFYNLDARCTSAALLAAGRNIVIVDQVPEGQGKRREINPVALRVQLACAGQPVGSPLDMGTLQAGQRYTVFLVPSGAQSRIFQVVDTVAR